MIRMSKCAAALYFCIAAQVNAQSGNADYYSPLVTWQRASGFEVTPIHAGLLPNGNVYFINSYNFFQDTQLQLLTPGIEPEYLFVMEPTPAFAPLPESVLIQPVLNPPALQPVFAASDTWTMRVKSLTCGGHSLTADGALFFAGGADATVDLNVYTSGDLLNSLTVDGIAESFTYSASGNQWTQNASGI